jgi:hypothetical protein
MLRFLGRLHEEAIHARQQEASEKPQHELTCGVVPLSRCFPPQSFDD